MQDKNKLDLCTNFILYNTTKDKYLSNRFSTDSRSIQNNQVFISLENDDDLNLINIKHALTNGASGVITAKSIRRTDIKSHVPFLVMHQINDLYIELFKQDYNKLKTKACIIGITGTNGKTSTTLFLAQALKSQDKKVGVISSEGIGIYPKLVPNFYTTPPIDIIYSSLLKFTELNCHYIIIECSSQGLHQGRVRGIKFDYGLITNIDQDHLDYHKSLKNYINTKLSMLNQCKIAVLNYDSFQLRKINKSIYNSKIHYISKLQNDDNRFLNMKLNVDINQIKFLNQYTMRMITAVMMLENMTKSQITQAILKLKALKGRRSIFKVKSKGIFIVDYAHTSEAYLNIFKDFDAGKKARVLFGCGGNRDKSKRKIIGNIVDKYSSHIIITEDNSRNEKFESIYKDILSGIKCNNKVVIIKSRKKAMKYMFAKSEDNNINFILGKGNEDYILEGNKKIKHNDIVYMESIIKKNEY